MMRASISCRAPLCDPFYQRERYRSPVLKIECAEHTEHQFRDHRRALSMQSRKGSQERCQTAAMLHQENRTFVYGYVCGTSSALHMAATHCTSQNRTVSSARAAHNSQ